jgi:predicted PurR-regulated permease PerM
MDGKPTSALPAAAAWQRTTATLATFVLAVACLYWARPVLIPLAVATLLTFMLGPAAALLERRRLPRTPSVLIVVSLAAIVLAAALWLVGSQLVQLLAELPTYQDNVAKRITEVREQGSGTLLRNIQRFVHEVTAAATGPTQTPHVTEADEAVTVRVVERAAASSIGALIHGLLPVAEPIFTTGLVMVLVVYLLIFKEDLRSRLLALVGRGQLTLTTKALDDAGRRISRYLLAQFGLNVGFGLAIGLGLLALRVPHALLWGFAAGLLRYIPYLGAWIACSLPIGMSVLVSDGWAQPLSVVGLFIVVEFFANLVVEPWLYGQSIGVSQAAWMIAIVFWTWLWGAVGLMLATPLTTCLVVMGKYVPALKFLDVLLGDEPVLAPDVSLYQRLLARDEDEAGEIVRVHAQTMTPVELCDRLLVPALVHARADYSAGLLSGDEFEFILAAVQTIAERHDLSSTAVAEHAAAVDAELPARPPLTVLGCPAQNGAETTALHLFQQLLDPHNYQFDLVSPKHLISEVLQLVEQRQPAAICIAALPAGGLAHTRHLCKRLKGQFPQLRIVVGRWGAGQALDRQDEWNNVGADYIGTSLAESMRQLDEVAQFLRPAQTDSAAPPPHFAATRPTTALMGPPNAAKLH